MNIKFYINNDILYLEIGENKKFIDLNFINLIFINKSNQYKICKNSENIESHLIENDYLLILGNEYEGEGTKTF